MSEKFKVDEVMVWQNQVGEYAYLNGVETTVSCFYPVCYGTNLATGEKDSYGCFMTDTVDLRDGGVLFAYPHELRRRKPPTTGEQSVMELFKVTPQPTRVTA